MSGPLRDGRARTDPASRDRRLRGRTYAIPFDRVWSAALAVAGERMRGWRVERSDDQSGVIEAEARSLVWKIVDDVRITVRLDENAQTRVDVTAASRSGRADLGRNRRKIGSYLRRLDEALEPAPGQVLDPTRSEEWRRAG